ncbi:hypothetical protein HaLaN_17247 [Haematococcus lacustris]|uniref:Uncharacterized protein n=1 Tax=Haematococcus lacustris TaxID=44745 RepID=A0A699ZBT7_HAELA|nr:hypothetical protein HaLaN_17247 [Haematococcus lacustris]
MNAEVTDSLADIVQLLSPSTGAAGRALIQFAHYKAQHNIFSRPIVQNAAKELPDSEASNSAANSEEYSGSDANDEAEA